MLVVREDQRPDQDTTRGVVLVRLDRPPVNALNHQLLTELADLADALHVDAAAGSVRAVVVTGNERAFAAGADIKEFSDRLQARRVGRAFRAALDGLASLPVPVIAAVNGFALGGGCELALACDLRVAGAARARFGQPEIQLGLIPGAGGTQRLARLVGPAAAKDLVWTGRQVDATEAQRIGLVDRVVADAEVVTAALTLAGELATGPRLATAAAKRAVDAGLALGLAAGLDLEAAEFAAIFDTPDAQEGTSAFVEKRPPRFE
jgi:enoyl-CoA hydratase/carnithine racemase